MPHSGGLAEEFCPYVHINTLSIICHCRTIFLQTQWFKHGNELPHSFWGSGTILQGFSKALIHVSARGEVFSESPNGEGASAKLIWLLAGFSSLWPVGRRAILSHWLLAGGCLLFLTMWAFQYSHLFIKMCRQKESINAVQSQDGSY